MLPLLHARLTACLSASQDPRWAAVEVAEDIDALIERAGQVASGTAIIMPWRERARPPMDMTGGFRQLVEEQYAIGIVLRLYDGRFGGERAAAFAAYKAGLEAALAGWVPPGCPGDMSLVGGETSPVTKGVSIYVQTWAVLRFLTGGLT